MRTGRGDFRRPIRAAALYLKNVTEGTPSPSKRGAGTPEGGPLGACRGIIVAPSRSRVAGSTGFPEAQQLEQLGSAQPLTAYKGSDLKCQGSA